MMGRSRKVTLPVRYVLMAKKSQTRGERKFGQMPRSLGYGISQKNNQAAAQVDDRILSADRQRRKR